MPDSQSQSSTSGTPARDRRLGARYPVRPTEYIEIGENNGGLILDISEGGMAVAAAQALVGNQTLRLRFQLPRFPETIETSGEIHWIGDTKKRAGVRFVDLSPNNRALIQKWIVLQNGNGVVSEPSPAEPPPARTEQTLEPPLLAHSKSSGANGHSSPKPPLPSPSALMDEPETDEPENYPPIYETQTASAARELPAERRSQNRRLMNSSTYVQLDDGNGGLISDLSESGFSFRAAKTLDHDQLFVRFQMPGSTVFIETSAWIIWKSTSKKKAGARFEALSNEARKQIAEWIGSQAAVVEPVAQDKKAFVPKISSAIASLAPDPLPVPSYISPSAQKPSSAPAPSAPAVNLLSQSPAPASSVSQATSTLAAAAAALPAIPSPVKPSAPKFPKTAKPVTALSLSPSLASPAAAPLPVPTSAPSFAPQPGFAAESSSLVESPFLLSSSPALLSSSSLPAPPAEASWYIAPRKPFALWKIAALIVLIGGLSFEAGILFYRSRQPNAVKLNSTNAAAADNSSRASIASSTTSQSNSPISIGPSSAAGDSSARPSSDIQTPKPSTAQQPPPLPQVISQKAAPQFADQPREFVDQPRAKSSQPAPTVATTTPPQRNLPATSTRTPDQPSPWSSNSSLPKNSPQSAAPSAFADQKNPYSPAITKPSTPDDQSSRNNQTQQPPPSSATPHESPAPDRPIASPATSSPAPSATPPAALASPALTPVGTVSSFSRFRAIRSGSDDASHSKSGGVLQMGALQSSPLPAYPPEALRQSIQGLVELDVFIGTDGNVQTVHLVRGPAELAAAAMTAVRGWHYRQTALGGRPVETEQSVYLTFKLGK